MNVKNVTLSKLRSYLSDNKRELFDKESKFFKTTRYE